MRVSHLLRCASGAVFAALAAEATPARMWRIINRDAVEIDWSIAELEFLTDVIPATDRKERAGLPIGASEWTHPLGCDPASKLALSDFPSHAIISSADNIQNPTSAAFDGDRNFSTAAGRNCWRSGISGHGLEAGEGALGIDFGAAEIVDVRCVRVTQLGLNGNSSMGSYLVLQDSQDGVTWHNNTCHYGQEYPMYKQNAVDLIVSECRQNIDSDEGLRLDFSGGYGHVDGFDCSWTVSCANPTDIVGISYTFFETEANVDMVTVYDGRLWDPQGYNAADVYNPSTVIGAPKSGAVQNCTDDEVLISAVECLGVTCSCPLAKRALGGCGADASAITLPYSGVVQIPLNTMLSSLCGYTCNMPCGNWRAQSTGPALTVRFQGDGRNDAAGIVASMACGPIDLCGIASGMLGGDGSTCAGCDGVANSGLALDVCGICGGDGVSCLGCDGVPHSGIEFDICGVCGGYGGSSCADPCNSTTGLYLNHSGMVDFSSGYADGHECTWKLHCRPDEVATVVFSAFETERLMDYVTVYDGLCAPGSRHFACEPLCATEYIDAGPEWAESGGCRGPNIDLSGQFHPRGPGLQRTYELSGVYGTNGNPLPSVMSRGNGLTFTFDSSYNYNRGGFLAMLACGHPDSTSWLPVREQPCFGGVHLQDSGTIDFAGGYGEHLNCQWQITCTNRAQRVRVSFSTFHLQENRDFVFAYVGTHAGHSNEIGAARTGLQRPVPVISTQDTLLLAFTSQQASMAGVVHDGFVAQFQCLDDDVARHYINGLGRR